MSGLALSAFVVSLVLAFVSMLGVWVVMALPLLLGVLAWTNTSPERFRGRALGMWAVGISLLCGSCSYLIHEDGVDRVRTVGAGVLGALQGKQTDRLEDWLTPDAREKGVAAKLRERFDAVVAQVGPYAGEVEAGGTFTGMIPSMIPPTDLVEVGSSGSASPPAPGEALWVRARFERETLHVGVVVGGGGPQGFQNALQEMREGASPIVSDLRFFRSGGEPPAKGDG
jgi:hypothetical protein